MKYYLVIQSYNTDKITYKIFNERPVHYYQVYNTIDEAKDKIRRYIELHNLTLRVPASLRNMELKDNNIIFYGVSEINNEDLKLVESIIGTGI